jgi:hypothetical protein
MQVNSAGIALQYNTDFACECVRRRQATTVRLSVCYVSLRSVYSVLQSYAYRLISGSTMLLLLAAFMHDAEQVKLDAHLSFIPLRC